jgi:hypothetical protein
MGRVVYRLEDRLTFLIYSDNVIRDFIAPDELLHVYTNRHAIIACIREIHFAPSLFN